MIRHDKIAHVAFLKRVGEGNPARETLYGMTPDGLEECGLELRWMPDGRGTGLFATQDFEKGDALCHYPIDVVDGSVVTTNMAARDYRALKKSAIPEYAETVFSNGKVRTGTPLEDRDGRRHLISSNQSSIPQPMMFGHKMNDADYRVGMKANEYVSTLACNATLEHYPGQAGCGKLFRMHYEPGKDPTIVEYVVDVDSEVGEMSERQAFMKVVAMRDIKKEEEICMRYGTSFWFTPR